MIVALLLMTKGIWGNNVVVVDGITNGTISANSSTASKDATVTLTVEPSEGYYITANDITIIKTGGGNMAQTRNDPNIADIFHPNASSIDAEGMGTYTFTMPVSDVKIEAVFRVRETVTGATVNLSASSFTYNGNTQAPSVTSVTKGDITYLASESTNGFADYDVSIPNSINATESPFTVNVTFRGKYTGTASADYTINQATISHVDIAAISDQTYTGSPLTPEPVVKDLDISTTPLVKGKDYTVSYADDHTNVSDAVTVTITGMGNYDNNTTASTTFKIIAATLDATTLNNKIVLSSTSFEYTGEPQAPTMTITGMTEGTDYTVKYKKGNEQATSEKPKDAGTYTIVVVGKGNYSGEVTTNKTFQITKATAAVATAPAAKKNLVYTGELQDLITAGTGSNGVMQYSLDNETYSTTIPQGKEAQTYTVYYKVVGNDNYNDTDVTTLNVTISAAELDASTLNDKISLSSTSFEYTGEPQAPTVTIEGMIEGTDFNVKYKNGDNEATTEKPKDAGTYTIVVVGKGNYSGEVTTNKTFQITKATAAVATAPAAKKNLIYTGELQDLITAGTGSNGVMQYSLDNETYSTTIPQGKEAQAYIVYYKVVGNDNYSDTEVTTLNVTISAAELDASTLNDKISLSSTSFEYTGEPQAPTVTIEGMIEGTDFNVKYKNGDNEATTEKPKEIGIYSIVIECIGNYTGEVTTNKTFQITKATAAVATAPAAKKDLVYTGELQDLITAGTGSNGVMQYSLDNETYSTTIPQGKEAQAYIVYYKVVGNDNYSDTEVTTLNVTISAAELDASTLNDKISLSSTSFEYTGEPQAPTVTITGMTEGTDYTVKYKKGNEQATSEKPKDAGTYTIVVVGKGNFSGEVTTNKTFIIEQPKAGIIDNSKPVTVDGETFYNLTEENAEVIDNTIQVDIALPSEADTRTTITTTGFLIFSTGTDLNMAIRNLKLHNIVIFIFTGDLYGDSSKLRLKGSATRDTRAIGDLKLTSGAEYEVISEGDMILTMKLGEEETAFTSISVRASSTNINAVEADNSTDKWYDLNGKRINEPTHKGLYIRNGKKVVIK